MTERRFTDEEVAAIFERAAEAQQTARKQLTSGESPEGMTLVQLQEIGKEVGIAPELIERAAKSVALPLRATSRRFLGLPVGVGRIVELERKVSDDEWDRLVVDLRETFDAKGKISHEGSFRQWTNGNLHALLEPTPTGHRLRLRTLKGDALGYMSMGAMLAVAGLVGIVAKEMVGGTVDAFTGLWFATTVGAGLFTFGALRVPGWARLRQRQMEDVAARLASNVEDDASP
jgi:hypothetical protein